VSVSTRISFYSNFARDLLSGVHQFQSGTPHGFKVALTMVADPSYAGYGDLTEIPPVHGYTTGGLSVGSFSLASSGSGWFRVIISSDSSFTASGGDIGPFRFISLYNDTAPGKPLVCYWDYGKAYTIIDGVTFPVDFNQTNGIFLIKPIVF